MNIISESAPPVGIGLTDMAKSGDAPGTTDLIIIMKFTFYFHSNLLKMVKVQDNCLIHR